MAFALRPDLYGCVANGRTVLLDLAADRYFALQARTDTALQEAFAGTASENTLNDLAAQGLIVETNADTHLRPTPYTVPRTDILSLTRSGPAIIPPIIPVLTQMTTRHDLAVQPLHKVISDIETLKRRHEATGVSFKKAAHMVARYNASRRFISAQDECLRWSIAMVRYLRRTRYFPDLVLGVRMMPFAAHAWVQDGETVLNDTVEYVSAYTPILVV